MLMFFFRILYYVLVRLNSVVACVWAYVSPWLYLLTSPITEHRQGHVLAHIILYICINFYVHCICAPYLITVCHTSLIPYIVQLLLSWFIYLSLWWLAYAPQLSTMGDNGFKTHSYDCCTYYIFSTYWYFAFIYHYLLLSIISLCCGYHSSNNYVTTHHCLHLISCC